ncbi:MAG TPA: PhzF family phenazine biosynthesis protein, partial [Opitutaceae bacterium]|nr:PhzF family phenazine biosynthesis protein [Opitutaceae bacterium]
PPALTRALHAEPTWGGQARDFMAIFSNEAEVRALQPDFEALAKLDLFAVVATAPGDESDFVSRFFAPKAGILEDHVTGSAHCTLVPYWSERLGKKRLHTFQRSPRGGELWCELAGDRVKIAGKCALYLRGEITV